MLLTRVENLLLFLCILLLPTQLGKHFWPQFSYIYSLPIDYLSPTIYFWDILVILLLAVYLIKRVFFNEHLLGFVSKVALNLLFIFLLTQGVSLLSAIFSHDLNIGGGLVKLQQYYIAGLFGVYIASQNFKKNLNHIFWPLFIALLFEAALGIAQVVKGVTVGFWVLGERSFSISTPAIAKFDFLGTQFLRPYATFPHPNTLAAFAVLTIPLLLLGRLNDKTKSLAAGVGLILGGIIILLSVSRVVLIVGLVQLVTLVRLRWLLIVIVLLFILFPVIYIRYSSLLNFDQLSLIRRDDLQELAWKVFSLNPFFGVGLNNFIPFSAGTFLAGSSRFLQPVHNIYLLVLSETGLLGLLGFLGMLGYPLWRLYKCTTYNVQCTIILLLWLSIFFLGFFDHYFLTQPQGIRLLFLIWGLTLSLVSTKIS